MGSRRDDPAVINSTNVFAALGSLRKKKKSSSAAEKDSSSKTKSSKNKEAEKAVFWAPTPISTKSWADVEDEEEDDYYATTAPPQAVWGGADPVDSKPTTETVELEESETEDEGADEVDDDVEEEHENEHENEHEPEAPVEVEPVKKIPEASVAPKDTERQLSKKELKKKGLEELDAVLAELGIQETSGQDNSHGDIPEKKIETNGEAEKKENAPVESKSARKKKKKDKSSKDPKEPQELPHGADVGERAEGSAEPEKPDDASATDVKERLKKVISMKKKKSSKEMDAAARAAASEAAARNARLAAAKKKEKNHYNQQPVR